MIDGVFKHADGGHYVLETGAPVEMKDPSSGEWVKAVLYRAVHYNERNGSWLVDTGKPLYCTTETRWRERFERVAR